MPRFYRMYVFLNKLFYSGTVRQNILFGREFEYHRYKQVVKVCSLTRDFGLLPYADRTIVGEKGISLSGGQRARINLARAVYKRADIYLLDDPLSAVDIHVGQQLFDNCIKDMLQDKIVILITHQLQYLKRADTIVVMGGGVVQASGKLVIIICNYFLTRLNKLEYFSPVSPTRSYSPLIKNKN